MTQPYSVPRRAESTAGERNVGYQERLASVVGGPLLALAGLSRGGLAGAGMAAAGGIILYRGLTGHCSVYQALGVSSAEVADGPLHVEQSLAISRAPEDVYRFWREFANLPQFMKHLQSVNPIDERHSHWVANGPAGAQVAWDAEITEDQPNQLIAWRSLPGAQVENSGAVRFEPAPAGRGTLVRVTLDYSPPAGALGAAVATLFGEAPHQQIASDLRRLRNILEAGEIPTISGQPSGQRTALGTLMDSVQHNDAGTRQAEQRQDTPLAGKAAHASSGDHEREVGGN